MTYEETLTYIHSLGKFSQKAGLDRMTAVLELLENPQRKQRFVHVAGTNGKGSTCAFLASIFRAAGYKTGLYISPFVVEFRERIQINGNFIPRKALCRLAQRVRETGIALTEFEFITAVAFLYFAEQACDVVVLETGLGGRLDATNTAENVLLSVITKIGLDHTAVLGDTIEKITAEKCGILHGETAVTAPDQEPAAMRVIRSLAENVIVPDLASLQVKQCREQGNEFIYRGSAYRTRLAGPYQLTNALTAIEAAQAVDLAVSEKAIADGLAAAAFPARLEVMSESPLTVLDGAHNADGARALRHCMEPYAGRITAVIGVMRDKNYEDLLKITLPFCRTVITVRANDSPRALEAAVLAEKAQGYCENVQIAATYAEALEKARSAAGGGPIFVFGSLYLASGIRPLLLSADT